MKKRRKALRYVLATITIILTGWLILTLYVEKKGGAKEWTYGNTGGRKAAIIFDPDPFYNLDERICRTFAATLSEGDFQSHVMTVAMAEKSSPETYDLYVFCANTYNWRPDWSVTGYIKSNNKMFQDKPVVAITLGGGSTNASQHHFEDLITANGGTLEGSYSLWLWRPNDESRMKESNVDVAVSFAHQWGEEIAKELSKQKPEGRVGRNNASRR